MKLPAEYYQQSDVLHLAKDLLGKILVTQVNGDITAGIICETEAYHGINDKASHAFGGRRTERTETMYAMGGVAYIYLCYGIHHLFNVVTSVNDVPHAVLIRGIVPIEGISIILKRKNISILKPKIGIGPGNVSRCLGIHTRMDKTSLTGNKIWIENRSITINPQAISIGPRIGVDYAGADAQLPYRFWYVAEQLI